MGNGVVFMGTYYSTSETFDYGIDCNHQCSITQVVMEGAAFCGGDTTLQLWNGDRTTLLAQVDPNTNDGGGYYTFTLTANTDYIQSFRVVETGDTCNTWRCRNSLSIAGVAAGDPSLYFQGWDVTGTLGECEGDCDVDSECGSGLYCYHTDGLSNRTVPGCSGTAATNVDYCIDSTYHPSMFLGTTGMTWSEANTYCTGLGRHLLSIHNNATMQEAATLCASFDHSSASSQGCWIGMYDSGLN